MSQNATVRVADIEFLFSVETQDDVPLELRLEVTPAEGTADTWLIYVTMEATHQQAFALCDFSVEWTLPIVDMQGIYFGGNPMTELSYLPYWETTKNICANRGVPYISLIQRSGENRAAFGSFDQITGTTLTAQLSEQTRCYRFRLQKPANKNSSGQTIPVTGRREEVFFVSKSRQNWTDVLQTYVRLNDEVTKPFRMPVPEHAFDPVFCTWTAIHHDISHDWILRNAKRAADLGFRTWITDDGWFIEKGQFADYSKAGDWIPSAAKFHDFKAHVAAVQALGLRYILWVAPFMVGKDSAAAKQYAHLLTNGQERERFNNLSPWHTETREIVSRLLEKLVMDYRLDGLKIDFLDSISVHSVRPEGADSQTLGSSLYDTLHSVTQRLLISHPDLLIEFRNSYTNLASRSYANLYRSSDVPLNFLLNRWQAVLMRLLAPDRAVHLDPALWHPDEPDTGVAVHLINLLVSVPMVSIELEHYPASHLNLIRYWIGFYNAHRSTLIHGTFKPVIRQGYIPAVHFVSEAETIIAVYDDVPVKIDAAPQTLWLLNASTQPCIYFVDIALNGVYSVTHRDKYGAVISRETLSFPVDRLSVEIGGALELKKL